MNQPFQITRHTPFEDLPEYLTVDELSTYLGLSRGLCYDCSAEANCRQSGSEG